MSDWTTIIVGWVLTFGGIAAYAFWLSVRSRQLGAELGLGEAADADGAGDGGAPAVGPR